MTKYLFHHNGHGEFFNIDNSKTSSYDWGELLRGYAHHHGGEPDDYAQAIRIDPECVTPQDITYDWELAGPGGASFRLHVWPGTPEDDVKAAVRYLRNSQDVVTMYVLRLTNRRGEA